MDIQFVLLLIQEKKIAKYLIDKLIENGIDINFKCSDNQFIIHKACKSGDLELVKYLIKNRGDVNVTCSNYNTLFYACQSGNLELVKYIGQIVRYKCAELNRHSGHNIKPEIQGYLRENRFFSSNSHHNI